MTVYSGNPAALSVHVCLPDQKRQRQGRPYSETAVKVLPVLHDSLEMDIECARDFLAGFSGNDEQGNFLLPVRQALQEK